MLTLALLCAPAHAPHIPPAWWALWPVGVWG
jgi:hypothetical protein